MMIWIPSCHPLYSTSSILRHKTTIYSTDLNLHHLGLAQRLLFVSATASPTPTDPHNEMACRLNPDPNPSLQLLFLPIGRRSPDSPLATEAEEELIRRSSCFVIRSTSYMSRSVIAGEEGGVFLGDAAARDGRRWLEGRGDDGAAPPLACLYQARAATATTRFGLVLDSICDLRGSGGINKAWS